MNLKSLGRLHYVGIFLARASMGVPGQVVYTIGALAFEHYVKQERLKNLKSTNS
jgi:hypothetical protein